MLNIYLYTGCSIYESFFLLLLNVVDEYMQPLVERAAVETGPFHLAQIATGNKKMLSARRCQPK